MGPARAHIGPNQKDHWQTVAQGRMLFMHRQFSCVPQGSPGPGQGDALQRDIKEKSFRQILPEIIVLSCPESKHVFLFLTNLMPFC